MKSAHPNRYKWWIAWASLAITNQVLFLIIKSRLDFRNLTEQKNERVLPRINNNKEKKSSVSEGNLLNWINDSDHWLNLNERNAITWKGLDDEWKIKWQQLEMSFHACFFDSTCVLITRNHQPRFDIFSMRPPSTSDPIIKSEIDKK